MLTLSIQNLTLKPSPIRMHPVQSLMVTAEEHNHHPENPFYTRALAQAIRALTQLTYLCIDVSHQGPDSSDVWSVRANLMDVTGLADSVASLRTLR